MPAKTSPAKVTPKEFKFDFTVVGLKFRMDKKKRAILKTACPVRNVKIVREQENEYDANAVAVKWSPPSWHDKEHLGYISADAAAVIAPHLDMFVATKSDKTVPTDGLEFKSATLTSVNGDDNLTGTLAVVFLDHRTKGE